MAPDLHQLMQADWSAHSERINMRQALFMATAIGLAASSAMAAPASSPPVQTFSFEDPSLQPTYGDSYYYNPTEADVTFNGASGGSGNGGSGLAANGSAFNFPTTSFGDQVAFVQNASGIAGALSLSLSGLTSGATYDVTFYTAGRSGYGFDPLSVAYNGANVGTVATGASTSFTADTISFQASGSTGALTFTGTGPTSGDIDTAIDNVTVSAVSAAPEPSSWALMFVGVATIGAAMRLGRGSGSPATA